MRRSSSIDGNGLSRQVMIHNRISATRSIERPRVGVESRGHVDVTSFEVAHALWPPPTRGCRRGRGRQPGRAQTANSCCCAPIATGISPKGIVEPGEEPIDAAVREVREETTLDDFPSTGDWCTWTPGPTTRARSRGITSRAARSGRCGSRSIRKSGMPEHQEAAGSPMTQALHMVSSRLQPVVRWAYSVINHGPPPPASPPRSRLTAALRRACERPSARRRPVRACRSRPSTSAACSSGSSVGTVQMYSCSADSGAIRACFERFL